MAGWGKLLSARTVRFVLATALARIVLPAPVAASLAGTGISWIIPHGARAHLLAWLAGPSLGFTDTIASWISVCSNFTGFYDGAPRMPERPRLLLQ
jgi:hypothetical protein